MPSSTFYGICRWVQDESLTNRKSVELEVTLASGITYSDHASEDKPSPVVGDPVVWVVTYPNSDDYATMLAGTAPVLPPSSSDIFTFCTRTQGGSAEVCDWHLPVNQTWIDQLHTYLAYWFPALHAQVLAAELSPTMSRAQIVDAISQIIQPGVPLVASMGV